MSRHILQVIADGTPGGGTTMVLGLCQDLLAQGFRVSLITAPASGAARDASALGVHVAPLDFFTSRFDLRLSHRLAGLIRELQPDLVHAHGARAANPFWQRALTQLPTPLAYTVHGYHFLKKRLLMRQLGAYAERRIARRAHQVIFVSEGDREIARRQRILRASDPSTVIYNGIDVDAVSRDAQGGAQEGEARHDLVFVGRMVEQKNPLFMIDVMAALKELRPATLIMVGGGTLEQAARRRAEQLGVADRITFAGAVDRARSLRALASSRLMVFPSLWEGLPIAPMEAMHLGLPVVASRISGTDEVVLDGQTGRLMPDFDPQAYARQIALLLDQDDARAAMARCAKQVVEQRFRRDHCTRAYVSVYEQLLAGPR